MTKEQVQARLELLVKEQENCKATLAAYEGAVQDCKYWLTQIDVPVTEIELSSTTEG